MLNNNPILWLRERFGLQLGDDPRLLVLMALCAVLLAIVWKNILTILQQRQMTFFSESVGAAARIHIFRFYQRAPFLWIVHNGVADLSFGLAAASSLAATLSIVLQIFTSALMIATLFIGLVSISLVPSLLFLFILGGGGGVSSVPYARSLIDPRTPSTMKSMRQTGSLTWVCTA